VFKNTSKNQDSSTSSRKHLFCYQETHQMLCPVCGRPIYMCSDAQAMLCTVVHLTPVDCCLIRSNQKIECKFLFALQSEKRCSIGAVERGSNAICARDVRFLTLVGNPFHRPSLMPLVPTLVYIYTSCAIPAWYVTCLLVCRAADAAPPTI